MVVPRRQSVINWQCFSNCIADALVKDPSYSVAFNAGVSGDPNQGFATVPVNALWVLVKKSSSMNLDISLALISLYRTTI